MSVAIIGLGIMGSAYASNLIKSGMPILGVDPDPTARARLTEMGGDAFAAPGAWIADCELVILSLVSPAILAGVCATLKGLVGSGQILLETGTFALADKEAAQRALSEAGAILLDCPVSGTGAQAATADLVMMASGPAEAVAMAEPLISRFTRMVIHAGAFGNGTRLKFVANHAVALHNVAAAETLNYADALGLERETVFAMLSGGAGQSRMSDLRMPLMMSGSYQPPTASMKMFQKDLSVIGEDIGAKAVYAPLFAACRELYDQAFETLPDEDDTAAIFEIYRQAHQD